MNVQSTNTSVIIDSEPFDDHTVLDEARIRRELVNGANVDVDPLDESIIDVLPIDESVTREVPIGANVGSLAALLDPDVSEHLRKRWIEIQGRFVDDPRSAVQQADALVSEVVDKITQVFAGEHASLDSQWKKSSDVSTEDLRKALQHYRFFFNRLVV
jgi:gas vesicle protein